MDGARTTGRGPTARGRSRPLRAPDLARARAGGGPGTGWSAPRPPEADRVPANLAELAGARRAALPTFVAPQLALLVSAPPAGDQWLHELKFDGYRILCRVAQGQSRLLSRRGNDWTMRFTAVARAAADLPVREALLDGEVAVLQPDGTTSFNALQNLLERGEAGELVYFVFDLLHQDGVDLRAAPLEARKAVLAALVPAGAGGVLRYSEHAVGGGDAFFQAACRLGLEGIISKRRDAPYRSRRDGAWLKTKCLHEQEFVIGGYTDPEGARVGLGALLLGVHDGGGLRYVGRVGTGFSAASARALRRQLGRLVSAQCPFADRVTGVPRPRWVRPSLVAEVAFTEWTPDGRLRHPSFKGIRQDKDPAEVVRERPGAPSTAGAPSRTAGRSSRQGAPRPVLPPDPPRLPGAGKRPKTSGPSAAPSP
jgi:bifunctional non-homologous end joining protein LigD